MRVADVMLAKPQYLLSGQTVEHAAKRMITHGLTLLPVCRSSGKVIGALTARDIVRAVAESRAPELCAVDDVMTSDFAACSPDDRLDEIQTRMVTHAIRDMVVRNHEGQLIGLLDRAQLWAATGAVRMRVSGGGGDLRPEPAPRPAHRSLVPAASPAASVVSARRAVVDRPDAHPAPAGRPGGQ